MFAETAYLFRHAVLREAAYQLQPPTQRAALHAQVVEVALQVIPPDQHDALALELADHAGAARDHAPAMAGHERAFLARAAQYAKARHLPQQTLGCLDRLVALEPDPARRRQHLFDAVAAASHISHPTVVKRSEACMELFDGTEPASLRCDLLRLRGMSQSQTGDQSGALASLRAAVDAGRAGDPVGAVRALAHLGIILANQIGQAKAGLEALRQAQDEAARCGDADARLVADNGTATVLTAMGRLDEALPLLQDCVARNEVRGQTTGLTTILIQLSTVHRNQGRHEEAERTLVRCASLARQVGNKQALASATANLGVLHFMQAHLDGAESHFQRALEAHRETGNVQYEAVVLMNLGNVASARDRGGEAMALYGRALALHRASGHLRSQATCLTNIGTQQLMMGQAEAGIESLTEALALHRKTQNPPLQGTSLLGAAQGFMLLGQLGRAEACARAAMNLLEAFPGEEPWAEAIAELVRQELLAGVTGPAVARVGDIAAMDPKRLTALRAGALLVPLLVRAEADPARRAQWLQLFEESGRAAMAQSKDVASALETCRDLCAGRPEFRGYLPRELTAPCRRALLDRMAATEPAALQRLRDTKTEVWQAMTQDADITPVPDWRDTTAL